MKEFFYKGRFVFIPLIAAVAISLVSYIVMQLWNNVLPDALHANTITFWQAMGLFILCKILFGFGKGKPYQRGSAPWARKGMADKLRKMTPEQRDAFRKQFDEKMCGFGRRNRQPFNWNNEKEGEKNTSVEDIDKKES